MRLSKALKNFVENARHDLAFLVEEAKLDFSMALEKQRRAAGLNYSALAEKIGTSAAYITKVFRGDSNLTIESMVKLAHATGGRLNIEIVDATAAARRWDKAVTTVQFDTKGHATQSSATVISFSGRPAENEPWKLQQAA